MQLTSNIVWQSGGILNKTVFALSGVALLTCVATLFTFEYLGHYQPASGELIENPDFASGLQSWVANSRVAPLPTRGVSLSNGSALAIASIHQAFARPDSHFVRIQAEVSLRDVRRGPRASDVARVDIYEFDPASQSWRWLDSVFKGTGDANHVSVTRTIPLPPSPHRLQIEAELPHASGTFTVHRLSARGAEYTPVFLAAATATLLFWGALAVAVLIATHQARLPLLASVIAGTGVISLVSLAWLPAGTRELFELHFLSIDHFALFLTVTLLLRRVCPDWRVRELLLVGLVIAASTECLQYFSATRSPSLVDLWSDAIGMSMGLLASHAFARLRV